MPLSERDQRELDRIAQSLNEDDPKFVQRLQASDPRRRTRRRVAIGGALAVVGLAVLLAGLTAQLVVVGVAGCALMFAGAVYAVSGRRVPATASTGAKTGKSGKTRGQPRQGGLSSRLEERWEKRRGDDGFR